MPADLEEVAEVGENAVGDQQPPPKPPWWKEDVDVWRAALKRQSSLVWLLGLLSLGGFYVAHAIEGSIGRLHAPGGGQAAGYRDLFFGKIHSSWTIWTDGVDKLSPFKIPGPQTFIRVHVAADTLFVAFGFIALMLLVRADDDPDRRRRRLLWVRALLAAFVADCVGNTQMSSSPSSDFAIGRIGNPVPYSATFPTNTSAGPILNTRRPSTSTSTSWN